MGKVTHDVALIAAGKKDKLTLGNIDSLRDWGHARDYVRGMWMFLQQEKPVDYVLATGKQYSVRDLVSLCFEMVEKPIMWRGEGLSEEGVDQKTGEVKVQISSFKEMVYEMMEYDMKSCGLELPSSAADVVKRQDKYCRSGCPRFSEYVSA